MPLTRADLPLFYILQPCFPQNKPGVEVKRPGRPINITQLTRLNATMPNYIEVQWIPEIGRVRHQVYFSVLFKGYFNIQTFSDIKYTWSTAKGWLR